MSVLRASATDTERTAVGFATTALVCGLFGLAAWAFDLWFFRGAPVQDWMVFYTAARAYLDGDLSVVLDGQSLTAAINQSFAGWLTSPLGQHPWVYPPPLLVLLLAFGALPPLLSVASFTLAGLAAAMLTIRRCIDRRASWPMVATLLLCPAAPFTVMTGQNAFFGVALLVGGMTSLARRPIFAGALLGLLGVKPQLCLMAGVALVAARQWRALGSATATAGLLAVASVPVLGLEIWRAWLGLVLGGNQLYQDWVNVGRLNGISVFACSSWLGAPGGLASALQTSATVIAGGIVYWTYRQQAPATIRLAVLLAATILAAPHASNSDALLLGLAASLFITAIAPSEARPYQLALCAAVWVSPLFNPPVIFRIGCITPVLVMGMLAAIIVAIHERAAPEAAEMAPAQSIP